MQFFSRFPVRHYFVCLFFVVSALFIAFTAVIYRHYANAQRINDWTVHNYEVARQSRNILVDLIKMETGVRGYLLTGRKPFLEPYDVSSAEILGHVKKLRDFDPDDRVIRENTALWKRKIEAIAALFARQVAEVDKGGVKPVASADMDYQKQQVDLVRSMIEGQIADRIGEVKKQRRESDVQQEHFRITLVAGTAITLSGVLLALAAITSLLNRNAFAEKERRDAEDRMMTVMTGVNDGLYDYNIPANTIYYSPAFKSMLGYTDEEMPDTPAGSHQYIHPDDLQASLETYRQYQRGEIPAYSNIFRMRHKEERWVWILSRGIGLKNRKGEIVRLIGTHTDITEHKKREEALEQLNAEMETFIYITSHDLRSPLVNLKGFAREMQEAVNRTVPILKKLEPSLEESEKTLVREAFEEDIPESLRFIERAVEKMDLLTTAVLDLSRIGRREYRIELVDTDQVVERCVAALGYEISQKAIEVVCDPLPSLYSDAYSIEQIFGNILDNAVKYLDPARPGHITVSATQANGEIIYSVADNGRGIEEADQQKVFLFFRRARNTENIRGVGIGMTFVQATVRRLGGEIWFESEPGKGSIFYFRLPKYYVAVR